MGVNNTFSTQLLQSAQLLVQNSRQKRQLEAQGEAQKLEIQQAERTFAFRERELKAREGFLNVQMQQLEQRNAPPSAAQMEMQKLETDLLKARIATERAKANPENKPVPFNASATRKVNEVNQIARQTRVEDLLRNGNPDDQLVATIQQGSRLSATFDREEVAKLIQSKTNTANNPLELEETRRNARGEVAILEAYGEALLQVTANAPSREEFAAAAEVSGLGQAMGLEFFDNQVPGGVLRQEIWGGPISDRQFNFSLAAADRGDFSALTAFLEANPGNVLQEGRLTDQGLDSLGRLLTTEGLSEDKAISFISQFSQRLNRSN